MYRLTLLLILTGLIVIGCDSAPAAETAAEPRALLADAVENLREATTFRLIVEHGGADYYFQTELGDVAFIRAQGQYVAPDTIGAKVKIVLGELPVEADIYAKGQRQSVRGLWTSLRWQETVFAPGFDPSRLVSQENSGLETAMAALVEPTLAGEAQLEDGTTVYHIRATAEGAEVAALAVGLIQMSGAVKVDIYVAKDSGLPARFVIVQLDSAVEGETPTTWTIDLYDFDAEAGVEIPA